MGYSSAPWTFRGRALYQLQLVPSDIARQYIPDEFKLVELFGYTLGGFYLARYDDSPVGEFDEMVAMAGLVWNPPTSCAWAARVFVNNREARNHGLQHVGLPSRCATFQAVQHGSARQAGEFSWWDSDGSGHASSATEHTTQVEIGNTDAGRWHRSPLRICTLNLPLLNRGSVGPQVQLSLPSFSGATPQHPSLLQYSCRLTTNVSVLPPVTFLFEGDRERRKEELLDSVLGGRALVTFAFDNMEMVVQEPMPLHIGTPEKDNGLVWSTASIAGSQT